MVLRSSLKLSAALKSLNPKHVSKNLLISEINAPKVSEKSLVNKTENIHLSQAFYNGKEIDKDKLLQDMLVYEDFLTESEEKTLLDEIEPYLKRLRYEFDHWDDAIHGYRETERLHWNEDNSKTLKKVRDIAFPPDIAQLAHVHVLDLAPKGFIKPHIDAVRFCGTTIAGLSLLSDSVMRLVHDKKKLYTADVLLKRRSLYIMRNSARFDYTHEILNEKESVFNKKEVPRDRRVSIICRNEPLPEFRD
ncbi:alpha-ketoglutarate-dependent dioxygenase alkB homolog 7, mitochondrial [Chrysoperla carnea]|uniref:alpha-ketoglutarate-dependent dioxygenase alkB homolog 7, mitochondrial n=1 Tax=Chrysoperla carnea TaxID=189513 RepID=UPI001D081E9C|nr:alpha-ketoglutarate-dependent dioxygenase alkB homolog 7, mitochondrial [Chrysoperla carnea]